jgi:hypothetical protein
MEITELFCCLDQKLGIQFCSTKNTINSAQPLQLNSGSSAVFGIEKYFSIFSEHIEVVGFASDIEKGY